MNKYRFYRRIFACLFVLVCAIFEVVFSQEKVYAQTSPFLLSPYYGSQTITQGWSSSFEPNHHAYDYDLNYQNLLSTDSGTVTKVKWYSNTCHNYAGLDSNIGLPCGFGLYIQITHGSTGYTTWYAHMSASAFPLSDPGTATVASGQIIGTSGNTGWSTGAHLHFETRLNNVNIDPYDPNLWKDGQWATPSRPIPQPVDGLMTVTVSSESGTTGGFYKGSGSVDQNACSPSPCGGWTSGGTYFYADVNGAASWAKWLPLSVPVQGAVYEIQVLVPSNNATSWKAPYTIRQGTTVIGSALVDQEGLSSQWVSIGIYTLTPGANVYLIDATGDTGSLRVAADDVRFVRRGTTYAPDVRHTNASNSWQSSVVLRNNGGVATYLAKTLDSTGGVLCSYVGTLAAHAVGYVPLCTQYAASVASVVVDASQDVSVVVETQNTSTNKRFAYSGIAQITTPTYLPALYKNGTTQWSDIFIQNGGNSDANIRVKYRKRDGTALADELYTITVAGRKQLSPPGTLAPDGSAIIEQVSGPAVVAVAVTNWNTGRVAAYPSVPTTATQLRAPSIYRVNNGSGTWSLFSATVVQNSSGNNANLSLQYINRNTGAIDLTITPMLGAYTAQGYNTFNGGSVPANTFGPLGNDWDGTINISSNQPLVGVGTTVWAQMDAAGHYRLMPPTEGKQSVVLSLQYRQGTGTTTCANWTRYSAINVMNVGSSNSTVIITYYNNVGTAVKTLPSITLTPGQAKGANTNNGGNFSANEFDALGCSFTGSAVVNATGSPVIAIANLIYPPSAASVYDGVGR